MYCNCNADATNEPGYRLQETPSVRQKEQEDKNLLWNLIGHQGEASAQGQHGTDSSNIAEAAACRRAARSCQLCHAFCSLGF